MTADAQYGRLDPISFGLAIGVVAAVYIFLLGLAASVLGWGVGVAMALSSLFIGYGPTLVGSFAGAVWAFFDGFVAGALIAWLYNRFLLARRQPAGSTGKSTVVEAGTSSG